MSDVRLCYAFPPIAPMLKGTKIDPRSVAFRPRAKSTARVAAHPPTWIKPQLTRLVDEAPAGKEWLHEIKYDGYRMHARIDGDKIQLLTRTGLDWSHRYKHTIEALRSLNDPNERDMLALLGTTLELSLTLGALPLESVEARAARLILAGGRLALRGLAPIK